MKKIIAGLLALVMMFALMGCGSQKPVDATIDKPLSMFGVSLSVPETWSDLAIAAENIPIFEDIEAGLMANSAYSSNAESNGGVLITFWEGEAVSQAEIKKVLEEMETTTSVTEVTINGVDMLRCDMSGPAGGGVILAPIIGGHANYQILVSFDIDIFSRNKNLLEAIVNSVEIE